MRPNMRPTEKNRPQGRTAQSDGLSAEEPRRDPSCAGAGGAQRRADHHRAGIRSVRSRRSCPRPGRRHRPAAAVAKVGVLLAVIYGLSALFGFIQHYIMASVTLKMSYRMRGELSEKINRVPQKYFNFHAQGDILSRITNDVSTLQQGLTNSLPTIISAATQFIGCLIMMFVTEWRLALAALGITLGGSCRRCSSCPARRSTFYRPAGEPRRAERLCGGDVFRPRGRAHLPRRSARREKFDTLNGAVYDANWRSQSSSPASCSRS